MGVEDGEPLDEKAKRMRDLLSSFYSPDLPSASLRPNASFSRFATLDTINATSFDADHYMNLLVQKANLEELLKKHVEMASEIKNLDTDLQTLVYENYNKFISATDAIKRMKNNINGMEAKMEQLTEKMMSVQSRSDGVNTSLLAKREHVEKLHCTRNLLRKVQFIYDLPTRLEKCIKSEAYADAVKFYTGAMPIFKLSGRKEPSGRYRSVSEPWNPVDIDDDRVLYHPLSGKVFSDSESIKARAEAVMLLNQLNFPVETLKLKLFEKLEQFLLDLHLEYKDLKDASADVNELPNQGNVNVSASAAAHEASIHEFAEALRAYRVIFLHSEPQLFKLAQDLVMKEFEAAHQQIKKQLCSADLLAILRVIWTDVLLLDKVLPGAALPDFTMQAALIAVKDYITCALSHLLLDISDAFSKILGMQKEGTEEVHPLQTAFEASKKAVIQGSMDVLLDFHHLLNENSELLLKLRGFTMDWVQEGFQNFFRKVHNYFLLLCGKSNSASQDRNLIEGVPGDKVPAGLVLVVAQLCHFIENSAIPRITEEIASSFSGGGVRGFEYGPAFVPAEICCTFRADGEMFLHLYIKMRTQRIAVILKKRFTTPNWVKHKEPREVHMFVDLLLQEFEAIGAEAKQILPQGLHHKHHRTDSNGSTTSSRGSTLRDSRMSRSNTQKARSQLLEAHLAKLFKQKMEIFTKTENTQESVITTILKLSLKSLQELVRFQTFNRSGFQQIQLDIQFLKSTLKDIAEDEAAVDFLLDEVIEATTERCLDPVPLEPPILDRLVNAKLTKTSQ
ncbi:Vps51/Vps67 family (components of vesicular transport) protein [Forsythia ovata]|uniref:Vacuolar protein sorting-associated protein 51 homolog n=1 Tax=Forsythia ovata TaxID=205694 RepID=A0ABD1T4D8_9LAMI